LNLKKNKKKIIKEFKFINSGGNLIFFDIISNLESTENSKSKVSFSVLSDSEHSSFGSSFSQNSSSTDSSGISNSKSPSSRGRPRASFSQNSSSTDSSGISNSKAVSSQVSS